MELMPVTKPYLTTRNRFPSLLEEFFGDTVGFNDVIWREGTDSYTVEMSIPGFKKDELHVKLVNDRLTISAQNNRGNYYKEVYLSCFDEVDANKGSARLEDGVLYVTLPKSERAKGREIKIE